MRVLVQVYDPCKSQQWGDFLVTVLRITAVTVCASVCSWCVCVWPGHTAMHEDESEQGGLGIPRKSSRLCQRGFEPRSTWWISPFSLALTLGGLLPLEEIKDARGLTVLTCPPGDSILTWLHYRGLSQEVCCRDDKLTQQGVPHIYLSTNY